MLYRFLTKHIRAVLTFSIIISVLGVGLFGVTYFSIREVSEKSTRQFSDGLVQRIEADLQNNNVFLSETWREETNYTYFQGSSHKQIEALTKMRSTFRLLRNTQHDKYNFFLMNAHTGLLIEITFVDLPADQYGPIRRAIIANVLPYQNNGEWRLLDTDGGRVVVSYWRSNEFVLGAWSDEKSLLSELSELNLGSEGEVALCSSGEKSTSQKKTLFDNSIDLIYDLDGVVSDFGIRMRLTYAEQMYTILILELVELIVMLALACLLVYMIYSLNKHVLIPIQNMQVLLNKYSNPEALPENSALPSEEGLILPGAEAPAVKNNRRSLLLADTYQVLDNLGAEVDRLSGKLYQAEIEKKQLQINFYNAQIRPHFLVNCLAMLSGMAQVGAYEKVQNMAVYLSRYLRYILQDCMTMVPLSEEINHIKSIVEIMNGLNNIDTVFDCRISEEAANIRVPVLVFGTFIENSIKHYPFEDLIRVSFEADYDRGTRRLRAVITDNSGGFSKEALEILNTKHRIPEENGSHIGINNVLERLKLLYGERADVKFWNNNDRGAVVQITLQDEEET